MNDAPGILLIQCRDRPGIVAAVSSFLYDRGANITDLDQHSSAGLYFMRLEFDLSGLTEPVEVLEGAFAVDIAPRFGMDWTLALASERRRVAVLVSRQDHALMEVLWAWQRGDLACDVTMVISNHPHLRSQVEAFGVAFHHIENGHELHAQAEARMLGLLETGRVELVVLARYMQILSAGFVARFPHRIINIHHSFLPAFVGADPYRQAYQRGVKIVGATAHYVTAELDAGPIIEQDVGRVSHRHEVNDLKRIGRDLERRVLSQAVKWHCEDRILVHENKTVVFD